ncbi:hypothetical protein [Mycetocola zhujimingii]|uniref:hypothetical protein n=1 Tax=Mycetocola zhujimingii TaxID=2079792 RepID=UPI0013C41ED7|nr:hypothetical protein [Mycetocola zhujimingii]
MKTTKSVSGDGKKYLPAPLLLTPKEASVALGRTLEELREMRAKNVGPTFHRLGGRLIRYSASGITECIRTTAHPRH